MFPLYDNNPTERTPVITFALVAINVLVFLWMNRMPELQQEVMAYQHGFVPARILQLRQPVPIRVPINVAVQDTFWGERVEQRAIELQPSRSQIGLSLITCMFLHGGWMHLLGNMWFLWLFGNNVEDRLGAFLYLFLYLLGGFLASGLHWVMDPTSTMPIIGASGAIAAVLGAYAVTWPWARVSCLIFLVIFVTIIDIPALIVLGMWFVLQVMEGQRSLHAANSGGVAWWAHVGGFLAGMFLMPPLSAMFGRSPSNKNVEDGIAA
jgi:membrane associated rhomboid family serine protease